MATDTEPHRATWINKFQYIAATAASLATLSTGTVLGWTSQISNNILTPGSLPFPVTENDLGWISSSASLGAAFLSIFIGLICDSIGRKPTMLALIVLMEAGWCLIIAATSMWMLISGRFLTGMAAGAYCVAVPLYINEISQQKIRGKLGCLTQIMIAFGILFANTVSLLFVNSIRWFTVVCAVLPLVFGMVFVWMPETPTYLLMKGKRKQADKSLRKLRSSSSKDYGINKEIDLILENLANTSHDGKILKSLKSLSTRKACYVALGIIIFRVFCGIDAITSYLSYIFHEAKTDVSPAQATIIFSAVQVASAFAQAFVIEKCGRKLLLIISDCIMAICLLLIGASYYLLPADNTHNIINYIPLISLSVYATAFSLGFGSIGWIICGEIFPTEFKSYAMSVCSFLVWFLTFANVKLFITISTQWGSHYGFFLYAVMSVVGTVFIAIMVPETKNKSFEEIQSKLMMKK